MMFFDVPLCSISFEEVYVYVLRLENMSWIVLDLPPTQQHHTRINVSHFLVENLHESFISNISPSNSMAISQFG